MTKALRRRVVSKRPDPEPCRDQDLGKFEVTVRAVSYTHLRAHET